MELPDWITKLKQARSREEVFAILEQFRAQEWTDEQRATVSRLYIRLLEGLKSKGDGPVPAPSQAKEPAPALAPALVTAGAAQTDHVPDGDGESEEDGPVWYEKM